MAKSIIFRSCLAVSAALAGTAAQQVPIVDSSSTSPLLPVQSDKPLVNSSALQDLISIDRLMERANKLYEIAQLSEPEHNHPTRVIGSLGRRNHVTGI